MIKLEKILAENMRRFGTKNLSEDSDQNNNGYPDSTESVTEKYYAIFNYLGDRNNGIPLYFVTATKEEMINTLNKAYREFTGETHIPYSMRDMEEQLYMGKPLETYISDDWATVTKHESVFKMELRNVANHLKTKPKQYT